MDTPLNSVTLKQDLAVQALPHAFRSPSSYFAGALKSPWTERLAVFDNALKGKGAFQPDAERAREPALVPKYCFDAASNQFLPPQPGSEAARTIYLYVPSCVTKYAYGDLSLAAVPVAKFVLPTADQTCPCVGPGEDVLSWFQQQHALSVPRFFL